MVQCKPQGQRSSATNKAGHHQQSGKHQQDPNARDVQALVPAVWTSPLGNVAIHYLRGPNNNYGEDGANHDFIQSVKKWLSVPRCLTNISLYSKGVFELQYQSQVSQKSTSAVK